MGYGHPISPCFWIVATLVSVTYHAYNQETQAYVDTYISCWSWHPLLQDLEVDVEGNQAMGVHFMGWLFTMQRLKLLRIIAGAPLVRGVDSACGKQRALSSLSAGAFGALRMSPMRSIC